MPACPSSRYSGFSGDRLETMSEVVSNCRCPYLSRRLSGNDVKIQSARQKSSVQSKIFANGSLDPVSRYGLPDLFRDGDTKARSRNLVFSGDNNKKVAEMTIPIFRQRPVFYGRSYSICLGKHKSCHRKKPFSNRFERSLFTPIIRKRVFILNPVRPPVVFYPLPAAG